MVIASSYNLFLNVIQEALDRLYREDKVLHTVDIDQRATTLSDFNQSENQTMALLVTANVGELGPIGRVRRIPQRRKVQTWEILAETSAIDAFMLEKAFKKKQVITMLRKDLVRKDTQVIIQETQPDGSDLEQFLWKGGNITLENQKATKASSRSWMMH
ncbi:unnamed protein product [Clonostachys rhizophaga]|uniref:Uncharacterized protein n=1 Tax=Clonostachys rhizophaga TaxID=160324 RepID=A0A9N9VRW2_9HYPO|nr:unnamed protein product [Clonostachys rhizophaga]